MKVLKPVAICLVMALIVFQHISKWKYYTSLFGNGDMYFNYGQLYGLVQVGFVFLIDLYVVVLGIGALTYTDLQAKDRFYSLFRFIYVILGIMHFPTTVLAMVISGAQLFKDPVSALLYIVPYFIWLALIVLLLICKPEKQVQKVNLQEYDMVAYTSTGHRFIHNLVDSILIIPGWISFSSYIYLFFYMSAGNAISMMQGNLVLVYFFAWLLISYLMYYFLAELIFKQTLGKMLTRSCVVGNGVALSGKRIFLRSLARLIPFDHISFLVGANWHDSASATAVVYINSWEKAFDEKHGEAGGE
jgi:hypothetical protein